MQKRWQQILSFVIDENCIMYDLTAWKNTATEEATEVSPGQQMFMTIFVAFLGSGIINRIVTKSAYAKHAQESSAESAIADGSQCILRDRIVTLCRQYQIDGVCEMDDRINLQKMYASYSALGGNDVAHAEFEKVLALPSVKKGETE